MSFNTRYEAKKSLINNKLEELINSLKHRCPTVLLESVKYSLLASGKRLRPILLLSANELFQETNQYSLHLAAAVEMIHTYSLIHDDLPSMDNDDYRRGLPTNHKKFGEAMSILAGDALLNLSYETMLENIPKDGKQVSDYIKAITTISHAAGMSGMVGGQAVDVANENNKKISKDALEYIHKHKTEALITASLHAGVLLYTDDDEKLKPVLSYGRAIGLAFQIVDDILDVTGTESNIGKRPGSDAIKGKLTYPDRFGIEASKKIAKELIDKAIAEIDYFDKRSEFLKQLAISIVTRTN